MFRKVRVSDGRIAGIYPHVPLQGGLKGVGFYLLFHIYSARPNTDDDLQIITVFIFKCQHLQC